MIEIKNLYKNYGSLEALKGISLSVPKGQILGLLGPNGAGKSTTLRILTGFLEASQGDVIVGGHSVSEQSILTRKLIGYLPESTPLYENMLVYDYLYFIAQSRDTPHSECFDKIYHAGKQCDILEFMHRPIGNLSKGQRQRVGLSMAILDDPEILILDEPTSGLDPNQIVGIRNIIRELGKKKTIIFSTHMLSEAETTCDRVVIISNGKITADDSIANLKERHSGAGNMLVLRLDTTDLAAVEAGFAKLNQELLGDGAAVECVLCGNDETQVTLRGSQSISDAVKSEVKGLIKGSSWFMLGMESKKNSLEDVFRELTN